MEWEKKEEVKEDCLRLTASKPEKKKKGSAMNPLPEQKYQNN
jgi:carboxylesterase type B